MLCKVRKTLWSWKWWKRFFLSLGNKVQVYWCCCGITFEIASLARSVFNLPLLVWGSRCCWRWKWSCGDVCLTQKLLLCCCCCWSELPLPRHRLPLPLDGSGSRRSVNVQAAAGRMLQPRVSHPSSGFIEIPPLFVQQWWHSSVMDDSRWGVLLLYPQ